jgi:hypothetical protein
MNLRVDRSVIAAICDGDHFGCSILLIFSRPVKNYVCTDNFLDFGSMYMIYALTAPQSHLRCRSLWLFTLLLSRAL